MFENILVPVDLTDKNRRAVEVARDLAELADGSVTLLHVIEPLDLPFEELEDFYSRLEDKAADAMYGLAEPLREAGRGADRHVIYGDRAAEIVRYSGENDFDLVVMTSRRFGPEGDTADWATLSHKVAIMSQTPVLLVK